MAAAAQRRENEFGAHPLRQRQAVYWHNLWLCRLQCLCAQLSKPVVELLLQGSPLSNRWFDTLGLLEPSSVPDTHMTFSV